MPPDEAATTAAEATPDTRKEEDAPEAEEADEAPVPRPKLRPQISMVDGKPLPPPVMVNYKF